MTHVPETITNSTLTRFEPTIEVATFDGASTFQSTIGVQRQWERGFRRQAEWLLSHRAEFAHNLRRAYHFLHKHAPHDLIAPAISWGADDSIQIEWHGEGVDLEIEFMTAEEAELYTWFHDEPSSDMDELYFHLARAHRAMRMLCRSV